MKEKNQNSNILDAANWRLLSPYAEAAPALSRDDDGSFRMQSNGRRDCFGRLISDKVAITAGTGYRVRVEAYPADVRDEDVCLHVLLNWYDENWDNPAYWPHITRRDYLKARREGEVLVFDGHFHAPDGLILANNPPVAAIYAELELCFKWSESGSVTWKQPALWAAPLEKHHVRLASLYQVPNGSKAEALARLLGRIDEAATQRPDILCLNETALSPDMDFIGSAVTIDGDEVRALRQAAKRHAIYIIAGLAINEGGILYNTALLITPDGHIAGTYRKIHVPLVEAELGLTPGDEPGIFDITVQGREIKIGIMICFDAEFPELTHMMYENDVEIVFIPTNGPPELGMRAKDSGAYWVLAAGGDGPRIFAPSGDLLAIGENLCIYEADLNGLQTREWTGPGPAHSDVKTALRQERRRDLYISWRTP